MSSRPDSEVYNYLFMRLAAANEDIAVGGRLKRFGPVAYRAGDQSTFAGVADTRPARPSHGNIAGFRQLQQTLIFLVPRDDKTAARKQKGRRGERAPNPIRQSVTANPYFAGGR